MMAIIPQHLLSVRDVIIKLYYQLSVLPTAHSVKVGDGANECQ